MLVIERALKNVNSFQLQQCRIYNIVIAHLSPPPVSPSIFLNTDNFHPFSI